jgi:hypothetical protein
MKRMYYAIANRYGSPTSEGFANTWAVFAFTTKASRAAFVENDTRMGTRQVARREIGRYLPAVRPFSGQCFCLDRLNGEVYVSIPDGRFVVKL